MNSKILLKFSLFLLLIFSASTIVLAQDRKVTGKVTEADGSPIPGVNVALRGIPSNVSTNVDGIYTIQVKSDQDVLVFSYVGFVRQQITVGSRSTINVTMSSAENDLNEVVIQVGYGTKKKSDFLGAAGTVSGEELQDIPAPNIAASMRNRIAGVSVGQASGRPGTSITLNIRNSVTGANTAGGTAEPLYIIDGITVDRGTFDALDASMVENITFLKDASAAIYGASGAKGVVLVTTKKGKIGKPSITYNGYLGVSDAASTPEMLSGLEHATLLNETYRLANESYSKYFSPADLNYIAGLNYKSWYDELWQPATNQRHNVSISGGSEKITFFAGGSYQNENANYAGLLANKFTFRTGSSINIGRGLKAEVNFNVDQGINKRNHNASETDNTYFERIITMPRWVPIEIDGKYVNHNNAINPKAISETGYYVRSRSKNYRINASLSYQPEFLKGLTARFQISQSSGASRSRSYVPPYRTYNFLRTGNNQELYTENLNMTSSTSWYREESSGTNTFVQPGLSESDAYQGFATLSYAKTLAKHSFDIIVGGEQSESRNENLSVRLTNQTYPSGEEWWAFDINTLTRQDFSQGESSKRSFFGRFNYDWNKRYFIEGVARLDASSNFATGERWGLAPTVMAGWIVSEENFFKNASFLKFINLLKLKASYGVTGDDRNTKYLWRDRFTIDANAGGYIFGTTNVVGAKPEALANLDATWERKKTLNVGVEATMFNNKLDVGIEVFRNHSSGLFDQGQNTQYPQYVGFIAPIVNYKEYYNWGSEFSISYKATLAKDLKLNTSVNFSYGNSVIDRAYYPVGDLLNASLTESPYSFGTDPRYYNSGNVGLINTGMFRTQADVDAWMAKYPNYRVYDKVPQAGWLNYEDTNSDGVINDFDKVFMYKNPTPWLATGINLNLGYKGFSLATNINAVFGGKVNWDSRMRSAPSPTRNILALWRDRWTEENPMDGTMPRFDDPSLTQESTFWQHTGTMIRINNMTLAYKAPTAFANKIGLGGFRLLLTGNNLWTIVNPYKYKDPYTSSSYDYPILRTISLGLSVNL